MKPDIIGTLYEPTGTTLTDSDGNEYPEMSPISGWHVNTPSPVGEWVAYKVDPATPRRQYAGAPTSYYTFPDKETFETYLDVDEDGSKSLKQSVIDSIEWVDNSPVPAFITMRQFWSQLYIDGVTEDETITLIESQLQNPERALALIELKKSQDVERGRPILLQMAPLLGYDTEAKMDQFFKKASKL